jgi:YggT family protein
VSRHLRPGLPQCQENARRSGTWLPIPDSLRGRTEFAGPEVRFQRQPPATKRKTGGIGLPLSPSPAKRRWQNACGTGDRGDMIELLSFINYLIELYKYIIIASVILSWLMAFGVVNPYNRFVRSLGEALAAVTEPILRPIRNALPDMGGLDLSPLVLLLGLIFIQIVVLPNIAKLFV